MQKTWNFRLTKPESQHIELKLPSELRVTSQPAGNRDSSAPAGGEKDFFTFQKKKPAPE